MGEVKDVGNEVPCKRVPSQRCAIVMLVGNERPEFCEKSTERVRAWPAVRPQRDRTLRWFRLLGFTEPIEQHLVLLALLCDVQVAGPHSRG